MTFISLHDDATGDSGRIASPSGAAIQCVRYGGGPPLVLVHGSFTDHVTNWEYVAPMLAEHFTIHAIARRGRGDTDRSDNHTIADEGADVAAVIRSIGEPVFLLGHSYGAQVALAAAHDVPALVSGLVLYEPPRPGTGRNMLAELDRLARVEDWDRLAFTFFQDVLSIPVVELEELRRSALWPPIVSDARASLGDVRALSRYDIELQRFEDLDIPIVLQIGSESPRDFFFTDALAGVLPRVRVETLEGQAHEGMTTAPEQYASAVKRIFLG